MTPFEPADPAAAQEQLTRAAGQLAQRVIAHARRRGEEPTALLRDARRDVEAILASEERRVRAEQQETARRIVETLDRFEQAGIKGAAPPGYVSG